MSTKLTVLLLAFLLFTISSVDANDWPQWRGPNRNGKAASPLEFTSNTQFSLAWSFELGTGFSSIAVLGTNVVSVGNQDDRDIVTCLEANSGEVRWAYDYAAPLDPNLFEGGPTATPTTDGGEVFMVSRTGHVACLDLATGDPKWTVELHDELGANVPTWGFAGSPLVIGRRVWLNAGQSGICLDRATGKSLWSSGNDEDAGYTSPVLVEVEQRQLALIVSGKTLNAVDIGTGEVAWDLRWITRYGINAADPLVVSDNQLVISSGYAKGTSLVQFDANGREQGWRSRELMNQMSPGVVIDGHVYAVSGDAGNDTEMVCLDIATGEKKWGDAGFGSASLIAVNDHLFILSDEGMLTIAKADSSGLTRLTSQQILDGKCWTPIAFAHSAVYARNAEGHLVCWKLSE